MTQKTFWDFVSDQRQTLRPVTKVDLSGKTVVVVGANTGIGFEATKHFATMNPKRLILACRNPDKGKSAISRLEESTGYKNAELWAIDLGQFSSVKEFADRFERDGGRLDLLVGNAAIVSGGEYDSTSDGWESLLQVNYLSISLLALLLLPRMLHTAKTHSTTPRLVIVSSDVHYWTGIGKDLIESPSILATLGSQEYCTPTAMKTRYHLTKLLNLFFVRALNDRLSLSTPLIVNAVNPGYCYSELRRDLSYRKTLMYWLMDLALAFTSEEGSRQLVWAAVGGTEQEKKMRGAYVSFSEVVDPSDYVLSEQGKKDQDRTWDELIDILAKLDSRVRPIATEYLTTAPDG